MTDFGSVPLSNGQTEWLEVDVPQDGISLSLEAVGPSSAVPGLLGLEGPATPAFGAPRIASESWDAWTPKFGIDYRHTENLLYYFSATRGFKSGGYNSLQPTNPPYDPEYIWAYEAGVKSELADDRVRLNAAAFDYDYTG